MYKALVMDLDGTAVHLGSLDGADISGKTKKVVARAQAKGLQLAAATGRPWEFAKSVIHALGLKAPCISGGGTQIIDPATGQPLWEKYLDDSSASAALDVIKRETSDVTVAFEGAQTHSILEGLPIEAVHGFPPHMRILYFMHMDKTAAERVLNTINAQGFAAAHGTPSWDGDFLDVHVTHVKGTKEHALQAWHRLTGVNKSETIAVGDSANDIPLFQSASLKIAVGDASPELKELADYIAPAQNDEALLHIIEKFLL